MNKKQDNKDEADRTVRNIKRATRRKFNAEEKIRIVLPGYAVKKALPSYTVRRVFKGL